MSIYIFLSAAAFLAGFIDAVAGGGGLITLPALVVAGVSPHIALGTNKFQSVCGTFTALVNFARKGEVIWKIAFIGVPFALIGSVIGAKIALFLPSSVIAWIIIVMIPPLAIFTLFSKQFLHKTDRKKIKWYHFFALTPIICFIIGLYDGFLGPGTGSFLILALFVVSKLNLINSSATAKTFNFASNIGALATFLYNDSVYFQYGLIMALFNIIGNITGSQFAIKKGDLFIKKILMISLSLLFLYLILSRLNY